MLEDKLLVWKFRHGSKESLQRIYEKYKNDLLGLAVALSNDRSVAEDVVHDVFVSFAEGAWKMRIRSSLKGYLLRCVANRVRNMGRAKRYQVVDFDKECIVSVGSEGPADLAITAEESERIGSAISELSYEQQEVIMLRLHAGMKFRSIARSLGISINTAQARYRYGLTKLRSMLNGKIER